MNKKEIVKRIWEGDYTIESISDCWCVVEWNLVDDQLVMSVREDPSACFMARRLKVDDEGICDCTLGRGISIVHPEFCRKDIPETSIHELEFDHNDLPESEHDIAILDALTDSLDRLGYYLERYGNFFLMVKYEIKVQMLKEEIYEWAKDYLSESGPIRNKDYYLLLVDNSNMSNDRYCMLLDEERDEDHYRVFELNNNGILSPEFITSKEAFDFLPYLQAPALCEKNLYGSLRIPWRYYVYKTPNEKYVIAGLNNNHVGMFGFDTELEANQFTTNKTLEDVFLATVPEYGDYYEFWDGWYQWFFDNLSDLKRQSKSQDISPDVLELLEKVLTFSKCNQLEQFYTDLANYRTNYGRYRIYDLFQKIDALIIKMAAFFPDDTYPFEYISISERTIFGGEWKSNDRRRRNGLRNNE